MSNSKDDFVLDAICDLSDKIMTALILRQQKGAGSENYGVDGAIILTGAFIEVLIELAVEGREIKVLKTAISALVACVEKMETQAAAVA